MKEVPPLKESMPQARFPLAADFRQTSRFQAALQEEVVMFAYVLVLIGVLSRYFVASHVAWLNFTAVTGSLIYFGARRSWREMITPLGILMVSDFCLTTYAYHYAFRWQSYVTTWMWYAMAMVLGQILLHAKTNFTRVAAGALLGPTSFFVVSNFGVWCTFGMYPPTLAGLGTCYLAALPFYRNDLLATSIVLGAAYGVPAVVRRMNSNHVTAELAK
jgi:hypothetical protein